MNRLTSLALFAVALAALAACEKTKEQFDFSKKAPDEFAIVKRAPLEMPADYALPPPRPGAARPQESTPTEQARAGIFGETPAPSSTSASAGETALLQKAGAGNSQPGIRDAIDAETAELAAEETPTIDRILKITGKKVEAPAVEVDPTAETNRIKANRAQGKPPTEGGTIVKEE